MKTKEKAIKEACEAIRYGYTMKFKIICMENNLNIDEPFFCEPYPFYNAMGTFLAYCAVCGTSEMLDWMIRDMGADPNAVGGTALRIAISEGCAEAAVKLLVLGAEPTVGTLLGAISADMPDVVSKILEVGKDFGVSDGELLISACESASKKTIGYLIAIRKVKVTKAAYKALFFNEKPIDVIEDCLNTMHFNNGNRVVEGLEDLYMSLIEEGFITGAVAFLMDTHFKKEYDVSDFDGNNVFHYLAKCKSAFRNDDIDEAEKYITDYLFTRFYKEYPKGLIAKNVNGETPIDVAIEYGSGYLIPVFIKHIQSYELSCTRALILDLCNKIEEYSNKLSRHGLIYREDDAGYWEEGHYDD